MSTPVRLETRQQKRRFLGGMALGLVASVYGLARRDIDAGFAIVMLVVLAVAAPFLDRSAPGEEQPGMPRVEQSSWPWWATSRAMLLTAGAGVAIGWLGLDVGVAGVMMLGLVVTVAAKAWFDNRADRPGGDPSADPTRGKWP